MIRKRRRATLMLCTPSVRGADYTPSAAGATLPAHAVGAIRELGEVVDPREVVHDHLLDLWSGPREPSEAPGPHEPARPRRASLERVDLATEQRRGDPHERRAAPTVGDGLELAVQHVYGRRREPRLRLERVQA